jgi:hypothetical protein
VWQIMRHGLATVSKKGDFDSLAPSGCFPLIGFANLIRSYCYFVVVAFVALGTDFDSPNTTSNRLLMDIVGLTLHIIVLDSPNSTGSTLLMGEVGLIWSIPCCIDAVEGSSRGRSGICKFLGCQPKRVTSSPRNKNQTPPH